jgi:membrane protein DedA with SNARE-associated domain
MDQTLQFLARHGYALLFGLTLVEQLGVPLPSAPVLLAAGALVHAGKVKLAPAIALAMGAALIGHSAWYLAGRLRGARVLKLMCSLSLEPDTCVRRTQDLFAQRGVLTLILAPWIPGLGGFAAPLAGVTGMSAARFVAIDAAGSMLWASVYVGIGAAFGDQLEAILRVALRLGGWLALFAGGGLALYLANKYRLRRNVLRELALLRVHPRDVKQQLDRGEQVLILDVRLPSEVAAGTLPGALALSFSELEARAREMARDREVVLFCS